MDDVIKEFLVECYENLDQLDRDLLALEQAPQSEAIQSSVFRTLHTIKGSCGILGLVKLEAVTHAGENLLSKVTLGQVEADGAVITALLRTVDAVRAILASLEATGEEGGDAYDDLLAHLRSLQEGDAPHPAAPKFEHAPVPAAEPPLDGASTGPEAGAAEASEAVAHSVAESNVRVDVGLLDGLMNLVGELVLARNQIVQYAATQEDGTFLTTTQHLNLVTTELQEGVMKTRMQPIGNVWRTIPRLVRDLAVARGKQVRVEMEGRETELDRTIIEAIKDPLTHLVRNALDHGLETPEAREAAGKPAEGCLHLRAFHEGGQVTIEISDDGRGIDVDAVKQKAVERGLVSAEQAERMGERDAYHLIFAAGFSTAAKVTNISGRGVGMDVVKTNIERIGGTVDVQSAPGAGTTFRLKIPLTLAIIPALVVTTNGDRYAIPQASLLELVMLEGEDARTKIEYVHDAPVYRLRGRILPLVDLGDVLRGGEGRTARLGADAAADDDALVNIVVLQAEGQPFGLVVDEINDTEEIVVKPLSKHLKGLQVFAGATIMGDGRVALILDLLGLVLHGHVEAAADAARDGAAQAETDVSSALQSMLVLEAGGQRFALPMDNVARLEEVAGATVERLGADRFVQYRGDILPLRGLADFVGLGTSGADVWAGETLQVVVCSEDGAAAGLVVEDIVDVVEEEVVPRERGRRPGVRGTAVLQGRVTDLLDVHALLASVAATA